MMRVLSLAMVLLVLYGLLLQEARCFVDTSIVFDAQQTLGDLHTPLEFTVKFTLG